MKNILKAIKERREELINRNPHEHEWDYPSDSFENEILATIEFMMDGKMNESERISKDDSIKVLKGVYTLLESDGKIKNAAD